MKQINIGTIGKFNNRKVTIQKFIDFDNVIIQDFDNGDLNVAKITDLGLGTDHDIDPVYLDTIDDDQWKIACSRFSIIKPLIDAERSMNIEINKTVLVQDLSKKHDVGYSTIYRWLAAYNTTNLVSALIPTKPDGGRGISRMNEDVDKIIDKTIDSFYINGQQNTQKATATEIKRLCRNAGLVPPHPNTVYNRIRAKDSKKILMGRQGYLTVNQTIDAKPGEFDSIKYPLEMFQMDHTLLDIFVVTEDDRTIIGRPYITVAIDIFSRMVAGLYISLDPPGSLGTGICLSNAILPKEDICARYELKSSWPIWGIMRNIHLDNAKEFKGKMLSRNAEEYDFVINWRPKGKTHYGAHIERYLGTLGEKIHSLPGTTHESIKKRKNYDSEAKAIFTLSELEKWIHTQIIDIYHNEKHSNLKTSPLIRYQEGIFGVGKKQGIGLPLMQMNPDKVRLDFLPHIERTIQRTGVVIDHIRYYSEIFRSYLFDKAIKSNATQSSFIFKRDPRKLSKIYFLDVKEARYVIIPYADMRRPEMSIWDYRAALRKVNEIYPHCEITEDLTFEGLNRLRAIEDAAKASKDAAKRKERKRKVVEFENTLSDNIQIVIPENRTLEEYSENNEEFIDIEPFDFDEEI